MARRLKIQREGPRWEVFRTLEVHDPATNTTNHWTISSTGDPAAPLGVCVNKVWSKLVSERSLRALLARKLWKMGTANSRKLAPIRGANS